MVKPWLASRMKQMEDNKLTESVLDPIQKTRCRKIYDSNDVMLPEVRSLIIKIFDDWKAKCGVDFKVYGIKHIGSSSGFQYTETSDVDITVVCDLDKDGLGKLGITLPNGTDVPNSKMPINYHLNSYKGLGALDFNLGNSENCYDVLGNTWEKKTDKTENLIPYSYVLDVAKFFMNAFDLAFSQLERDRQEYELYKALDPNVMAISEKEKKDAIDRKIIDIKTDLDSIRMGNHVLHGFRVEAYDPSQGPFRIHIDISGSDDPHRTINDLVYKMMERYGYREKIEKLIPEIEKLLEDASGAVSKNETQESKDKEIAKTEVFPIVRENYSDSEISDALLENGYENTTRNIEVVRNGLNKTYYIVESDCSEDELFEDFKSRTEHRLHKTLYKVSGKWTNILPEIIGILLAGVPGLFISTMLHIEHNVRMDSVQQDLYAEVKDDDECNSIINDIKGELNKPKPDKKAVKAMRERFKNRLFALKNKIKAERIQMDDSGKAKFLESCTDGDIKALLLKEGYAQTDHNVAVLKYDRSRLEKLYESAQVHEDSNGKPYTMDGSKRDYADASAKEEPSDGTAGKPSAK